MKHVLMVLTLFALLAPAAASAQQQPRARRDTLEAMVIRRFVARAGAQMALDEAQRRRLDETLQATADQRRMLNQRSIELQRRLNQAVRRRDTPEAEFAQLLASHRALRHETQKIMDQEQAALGRFLTPRQQAHFLTLWVRLQQEARRIQAREPGGGPAR